MYHRLGCGSLDLSNNITTDQPKYCPGIRKGRAQSGVTSREMNDRDCRRHAILKIGLLLWFYMFICRFFWVFFNEKWPNQRSIESWAWQSVPMATVASRPAPMTSLVFSIVHAWCRRSPASVSCPNSNKQSKVSDRVLLSPIIDPKWLRTVATFFSKTGLAPSSCIGLN